MRNVGVALLAASLLAGAPAEAGDRQTGVASWYGGRHHGRLTASGQRFDKNAATVAHPTLPLLTIVRIRNLATGAVATAEVTDRGPYVRGRIIDVSEGLARRLDMRRSGTAPVEVRVLRRPHPRLRHG